MDRKPKVLVFSTGDSTRSQMAEGFLRTLASDQLVPVSTSVQSPDVSPLAIEVMSEVGVDISGQHSEDVAHSLREHFACVVTVCDASKERFPIWPFTRNILHWNLSDPEQVTGSPEEQREAFRQVRDAINRNVQEFVHETLPTLHHHHAAAHATIPQPPAAHHHHHTH
jgi:arsenate reductase (thioredoxin)